MPLPVLNINLKEVELADSCVYQIIGTCRTRNHSASVCVLRELFNEKLIMWHENTADFSSLSLFLISFCHLAKWKQLSSHLALIPNVQKKKSDWNRYGGVHCEFNSVTLSARNGKEWNDNDTIVGKEQMYIDFVTMARK